MKLICFIIFMIIFLAPTIYFTYIIWFKKTKASPLIVPNEIPPRPNSIAGDGSVFGDDDNYGDGSKFGEDKDAS